MNDISMCLEHIADAIRNLDPFVNPPVKVRSIQVGMEVGRCKNCNHPVKLRQPWLSKMPVVKDGYYLVHCSNEDCHNYYGMELSESQFGIADFVEWDEKHLIMKAVYEKTEMDNVIQFKRKLGRLY